MAEEIISIDGQPGVQFARTPTQVKYAIQQLLSRSPDLTIVLTACTLDDNVKSILDDMGYPIERFEAWQTEHNTLLQYVVNAPENSKAITLIGG